MTNQELFVSVDVETAGPIPGEYSLLAIGACLVDDDTQSFSCYLKPTTTKADPKALEVSGLSLERLEETGLPASEAMRRFDGWATSLAYEGQTLVFVGFNASFDWSFVNYYLWKYLGRNPFGFAALDIKSFYMGALNCGWADTRSSRIARDLKPSSHGDHDALHDAKYQAELFRLMRTRAT